MQSAIDASYVAPESPTLAPPVDAAQDRKSVV